MSQSREDYVKFIYEHGDDKMVTNKSIAEGLSVSPASVSEMIGKLANDGLIDYTPYHGVKLTEQGKHDARSLIKKHVIWEYFLEKKLNYTSEEVHELAEVLEHVTPVDLANRLAEYIDFPDDITEDPHAQ